MKSPLSKSPTAEFGLGSSVTLPQTTIPQTIENSVINEASIIEETGKNNLSGDEQIPEKNDKKEVKNPIDDKPESEDLDERALSDQDDKKS